MPAQKRTKPNTQEKKSLSPAQATAIELLVSGSTVKDAAESAGVRRETCSEWLNHSSIFQASLNQRRAELFAEQIDRLRLLVPRALAVLEAELQNEKRRLRAAESILKLTGIDLSQINATLNTDARDIESRQQLLMIDNDWFEAVEKERETEEALMRVTEMQRQIETRKRRLREEISAANKN